MWSLSVTCNNEVHAASSGEDAAVHSAACTCHDDVEWKLLAQPLTLHAGRPVQLTVLDAVENHYIVLQLIPCQLNDLVEQFFQVQLTGHARGRQHL